MAKISEMTDLDESVGVGQQIRDLRKAKGLSTAALAKAIGKSAGYINNVERERSDVSLSALNKICEVLDVQLSWFFQGFDSSNPEENGLVVRHGSHRQLNLPTARITEELLSPRVSSQVKMIRTRFAPGATTGKTPISTPAEITGFVLSGTLSLNIDGTDHELNAGDSFFLPEDAKRRCTNSGTEDSISIWVITPPIY